MTRSKWIKKLYTRACPGNCGDPDFHTHHLTLWGRWHYVYRYHLWSIFVPDFRPQPPAGELWYKDYIKDWAEQYPNYSCTSCWVRDTKEHWVWVTDTPGFDRLWFDEHHWQFPGYWISSAAKEFYTIGYDNISTIVNLEELS